MFGSIETVVSVDWLLKLRVSFAIYFRPIRVGFAPKDFLAVVGINELNCLFVLYHLICSVYTKTNIHLSVCGQR